MQLPKVWGEGGLFAFSGLDGETNTQCGFVAAWGAEPYSLLIHTRKRVVVRFEPLPKCEVRFVTGDAFRADSAEGPLTIAYQSWHTIVGCLPEGTSIVLTYEDNEPSRWSGQQMYLAEDPDNGDFVALAIESKRRLFTVCYGRTAQEAVSRTEGAAGFVLDDIVNERLALFRKTPRIADDDHMELLQKCISVMKVNSLQSEGTIRRRWSTPDRVPHKDMWLWDSVFHSFAMNDILPDVARDYLLAVLEMQQEGGMIPHQGKVTGERSAITQPPILAWGVWENYQKAPDTAFLREAFPVLERYLTWNLQNRDANGNGLMEWRIDHQAKSRSGESGMDNSPRFDRAVPLDAVDFSTFMAQDMGYLSRIAGILKLTERESYWRGMSARTANAVMEQLWDERDGFFYDKDMDGEWSRVKAVSGFLPLLLEGLSPDKADRLVEMLKNPAHFGSVRPIPSVAVSDPAWGTDMWRGPVWINYNFLIMRGLRLQGKDAEVERLRVQTIDLVLKYYKQFGVVFEYFDAKDERTPVELDRKGKPSGTYNFRVKFDCIRDFHWTAALTACAILQSSTVIPVVR